MLVSDGVPLAESGVVSSGQSYEVRVRTRAPAGTSGPWSAGDNPIVANANLTAAAPVTSISGLTWVNSASSWAIGSRVYRNTVDDPDTSELVGTVYGSPGTIGAFVDDTVPGVYYYWIASWTGSFVEGTKEPTGAVIIG